MSGTSSSKFTAAATVPNQEAWGSYQRFSFEDTFPHVRLQAFSQFVPTAINTSTINFETRNSKYAGFRFQQLSQTTDTNQFGSFYFKSFLADGAGTNIYSFDGTNFNFYFPVFMNQPLDMGSKKITNLANPLVTTDALNLGFAETLISGSGLSLTGDVNGTGTVSGGIATTIVATLDHIPIPTGPVNFNSQNIINVGNIGAGVSSPSYPLQFATATSQCKICLYSSFANNFQVYGFGVNGGILKYTVDQSSSSHVFYCGASSTTSTELFRIAGTGYATVSGGNGTFYSRVPSSTWAMSGSSATTSCVANTWIKAAGSSALSGPSVQFTNATNKITFNGTDLSTSCVGMFSATACLSAASGTPKFGVAVYLNGTSRLGCQAYSNPSTTLTSLTISNTMCTLSPGDFLEIWILSSTTVLVTVSEMSLSFIAS